MRIREIHSILRENMERAASLKITKTSNAFRYDGYLDVLDGLSNLSRIEFLKPFVEELVNKQSQNFRSNSFDLSIEDGNAFNKRYNNLKNIMGILRSFIESLLDPQDENALSFKLYSFESYKEFYEFCRLLNNKILSPLNIIGETVELGDLEFGSKWINLVVGSILGLSLIIHITRASFDILNHDYILYRQANKIMELQNLQQEQAEQLSAALGAYYNSIVEEKAKEVIDEIIKEETEKGWDFKVKISNIREKNSENFNEFKSAIEASIKETARQLDKGLEIYQAFNVPDEKRYHLPDFSVLSLIKGGAPKKRIENKSDLIK